MNAEEPRPLSRSLKTRYSFLNILTGSDLSRRRLPFMVAESLTPGPVVWLTASGHGDEVGGIVVVQEVFKRIRKSKLTCGAIHAFPLMNPVGFETGSRNIALTKEDLNRSFPGNKNGSVGERIADRIFRSIVQTRPAIVLDLHNDWIRSIPYAVIDPISGPEYSDVYNRTREFGEKTGFLLVRDSDIMPRTLSYCLLREQIPALTLELGAPYVLNEMNTEYGLNCVMNILASLGMVETSGEYFRHSAASSMAGKTLVYSGRPYTSRSGIIRFLAQPGQVVKTGQPLAKVYNTFGKLQETISAANEAVVLGHSDSSVVFPGTPIMAFGVPTEDVPQTAS